LFLLYNAKILSENCQNGHYAPIGARGGETLLLQVIAFDQWEHAKIYPCTIREDSFPLISNAPKNINAITFPSSLNEFSFSRTVEDWY